MFLSPPINHNNQLQQKEASSGIKPFQEISNFKGNQSVNALSKNDSFAI